MCGRYMITSPPEAVARLFTAAGLPNFPPRYNVAPSDDVLAVRSSAFGVRELVTMRWGLVHKDSREIRKGRPLINARSETVDHTRAFQSAYRERRCLVPADGYFEWDKRDDGRQPFLFRPRDHSMFAFAGLWEEWRDPAKLGAQVLRSCTILTTGPSDLVQPLHNRMPVILAPDSWPPWLGETPAGADELRALLQPGGDEEFECIAVSRRLNRVVNDDPTCIESVDGDLANGGKIGLLL